MGGVIGHQRLFRGGGDRFGQVGGGQFGQGEAARLGHEGRHPPDQGLRRRRAALHRALQNRPRRLGTQLRLEFALAQPLLAQGEAVGVAVETAVEPLEGRQRENAPAHLGIADRKPDPRRLVIQCRAGQKLGLHGAVDAQRLRHRQADRLADLLGDPRHLAVQRAGIIVERDLAVADRADRAQAAAEVGRTETAEAEDQQRHQHPDDGIGALLAQGRRHAFIPPRGSV